MSGCRHETHVIRAAEENAWSESLRSHVESCDDCAAAASTAVWMTQFSALDDRERVLPDPAIVFLKAQLLAGTAAAERAARPITMLQIGAYLSVAACWATVLTWKSAAFKAWFASFSPSTMVRSAAGIAPTLSLPFLATIFVLASLTALLALHTILAEE